MREGKLQYRTHTPLIPVIPGLPEDPAARMESRRSSAEILKIILVFIYLSRDVASVDLIPYFRVHPGQRYENVTSESQELSLGSCTVNCVLQEPSACSAFNYRETDGSCQLILNGKSKLVEANGYLSYVQKYPMIENAKVSFEKWSGEYPAPAGVNVILRCEHPNGFSDGAHLHTVQCASFMPDSWQFSFRKSAVQCEEVHLYPECRLTEKGKEYVGGMSVTESGKKCLFWRDYPYGRPDDFSNIPLIINEYIPGEWISDLEPGIPSYDLLYESHFLNRDSVSHRNYCRNPSGRERPWCFVSDPDIKWEYCNIPFCTDAVAPECKVTRWGGEYVGTKNVTIQGWPCLPWKNQEDIKNLLLAFPDPDRVDEDHNFCRNPNVEHGSIIYNLNPNEAPWCYLDSRGKYPVETTWAFCDIPFCDVGDEIPKAGTGVYPECRLSEKGREYVGSQNKTETGTACLPWYPRPYKIPMDFYPKGFRYEIYFMETFGWDETINSHNHCRNPGVDRERPWCFVSDSDIQWEYCDIPFCQDLS
ncbi:unnamed protein product [Darwinula stevensoni]|uniref:Kringle domain-containing protein n=1 Tax=Darwinula stevensoni TaxID=69355 RepID=A0A7R9A6R9_9CRUS|nr:unnamed protein product [Darwinula stevensoni]CAG0895492.1 unnamed protein product [Darwinula stevensoni]